MGINSTRRGAYLEQEVRHTDLQLVVTDRAGLAVLDGLDIGVPRDRFLLVDDPSYTDLIGKHACEPTRELNAVVATWVSSVVTGPARQPESSTATSVPQSMNVATETAIGARPPRNWDPIRDLAARR